MCEVDWTKPVECKLKQAADWRKFRVLSYSIDYPTIVYGVYSEDQTPGVFDMELWSFRNTPPPPPAVWVVWFRTSSGELSWDGTYMCKQQGLSESYYQQKVTCDAPELR